jgi:hypothetical protein
MIAFAIVCFIAGMLLGMRFKVAGLLPAMFVVSALMLSFGILSGQAVSFIVFSQFVAFVTIQLGYLSAVVLAARSARKLCSPHGVTVRDPR